MLSASKIDEWQKSTIEIKLSFLSTSLNIDSLLSILCTLIHLIFTHFYPHDKCDSHIFITYEETKAK